ncbi:MAG: hypothetical protein GF381_02405 [Candidatus Pacebacteria bacterium]|nr:hypothetical protein [Candidatus Paceibacterota bacterium]
MWSALSLAFFAWFLTLLLQLGAFPLLNKHFKGKLIDRGWAFGRLTAWLIVALPIWFMSHLGLQFNSNLVAYLILALLSAFGFLWYQKNWSQLEQFFEKNWLILLLEEWLFLAGFSFLVFIRAHKPDIIDLEKFMDAGLIQAYLRSPTLPIQDMWLAGEKVNYYTFGHFLGSIMTRLWNTSLDYSYNLLLGLIMGLVLTQVFSLAINLVLPLFSGISSLSPKQKNKLIKLRSLLKVGLVAVILVAIGGNGHTAWYFFKNQGFSGYWYPDATRFIERTIHEFPSYSFIVSDLHGHVWGLPLVLLLLINLWVWLRLIVQAVASPPRMKKILSKLWRFVQIKLRLSNHSVNHSLPAYVKQSLILGVIYGLLICTSTWDFLIYGLFISILSVLLILSSRKFFLPLILSALVVAGSAFLTASPWLLNFTSISEGVRITDEHSPLWQLLVLWGPHLSLSFLSLIMASFFIRQTKKLEDKSTYFFAATLVISATFLLILPELVYMKDIYPSHPRANTMFKLTFQAFVLMGLSISWLLALVQNPDKITRTKAIILKLLIALLIVAVGIYPYFGYRDYYNRLKNFEGLDGLTWLKKEMPGDYALVQWLRLTAGTDQVPRPVILESVGESYTKYARISTFSGLPTVLGWRVHQWLWRGGFEIPGERTEQVRRIYLEPESRTAKDLLTSYQVKYIVVGQLERDKYPQIDEQGLKRLGQVVFSSADTYLIEVEAKNLEVKTGS